MKRPCKAAVAEAERLGFVFERTNSKNFLVYSSPAGAEIMLSPEMNEHAMRGVLRQMQRMVGAVEHKPGRNAAAVKERQARRRELDAERLAAERRQIEDEHAAFLARTAGAVLTKVDRRDLRRIEARLAEVRRLESQMVEVPAGGDHAGRRRAQHQAGER